LLEVVYVFNAISEKQSSFYLREFSLHCVIIAMNAYRQVANK